MRTFPHVVIMAMPVPIAFSSSGEYLAYSSPDGTLKLWETATNSLKHEYTPSSHLSATCTCLCWGPSRQNDTPRKKKKRRSSTSSALQNLDLVAMGTSSGTLLLYSLVKGDLQTQLTDGHSDRVNCVCWHRDGESLYSCSNDQYIVQWSAATSTVKQKWKADKGAVYAISICHTEKHLLSASRKIKLWDLDTRELLKTFTGHATEVIQLLPIMPANIRAEGAASNSSSVDQSYFLSAALGDRLINAWQINMASAGKSALASFALPEEVLHIHINAPTEEGQPFLLAAVTRNGQLFIFEHQLNGRCQKPLQPVISLQVATDSRKDEAPRPVPVLSAWVCTDADRTVLLAHGSLIKPTLERMPYKSLEGDTCLIREDPNRTLVRTQTSVSKVKTPDVSKHLKVLAPELLAPSLPSMSAEGGVKASKRKRRVSLEMTMEERLNAISIDRPERSAKQPPKTDTMATLLAQALQSQDKKVINVVLQNRDETIIRNTVKRLPLPVVVPLVKELTSRMRGHAQSGQLLVKWVKAVLTLHSSYLMTYPELVQSFSGLYQMMETRVSVFGRMSRLQGKLDLMLSQITSQSQEDEGVVGPQQPMLVYQDESSDEDFGMDDIIPDHSESGEDWEDEEEEQNDEAEEADMDSEGSEEGGAGGGGEGDGGGGGGDRGSDDSSMSDD